jgi:hypothetical protein
MAEQLPYPAGRQGDANPYMPADPFPFGGGGDADGGAMPSKPAPSE